MELSNTNRRAHHHMYYNNSMEHGTNDGARCDTRQQHEDAPLPNQFEPFRYQPTRHSSNNRKSPPLNGEQYHYQPKPKPPDPQQRKEAPAHFCYSPENSPPSHLAKYGYRSAEMADVPSLMSSESSSFEVSSDEEDNNNNNNNNRSYGNRYGGDRMPGRSPYKSAYDSDGYKQQQSYCDQYTVEPLASPRQKHHKPYGNMSSYSYEHLASPRKQMSNHYDTYSSEPLASPRKMHGSSGGGGGGYGGGSSRTNHSYGRDQNTYPSNKPSVSNSGGIASSNDSDNSKMIQVSPGVFLPLRGAKETWDAVLSDFYVPCSCLACSSTIFCIADAGYVLCPLCTVVNPVSEDGCDDHHGNSVGLGFTMENLATWQRDLGGVGGGNGCGDGGGREHKDDAVARKMAAFGY